MEEKFVDKSGYYKYVDTGEVLYIRKKYVSVINHIEPDNREYEFFTSYDCGNKEEVGRTMNACYLSDILNSGKIIESTKEEYETAKKEHYEKVIKFFYSLEPDTIYSSFVINGDCSLLTYGGIKKIFEYKAIRIKRLYEIDESLTGDLPLGEKLLTKRVVFVYIDENDKERKDIDVCDWSSIDFYNTLGKNFVSGKCLKEVNNKQE